jgi:uncharacterized protein YecT (DUF1311 family)
MDPSLRFGTAGRVGALKVRTERVCRYTFRVEENSEGGKMRSCYRLVALFLFFATATAWSRQTEQKKPTPPPDPCPLATTDVARTNCWEDLANKADANLNALYRQLQAGIRAKIAEDGALKEFRERSLEKLKAAQAAWSRYRDAQCDATEQQYERGTIAPSIRSGCIKELSERRAEELRKTYALYFH